MKKYLLFFILIFNTISSLNAEDEFKEVSLQAGIKHIFLNAFLDGGGCAFFDYDNDGYLDLYVTGGMQRDKLYHSNGDGTFEEVGEKAGLRNGNAYATQGVAIADINNDGLDDIYITCFTGGGDVLYKNKGDGTFEDISVKAGIGILKKWSTSVTFGDYNLDGYLDIFIATYGTDLQQVKFQKNILWINNKNETFTEQTDEYGIHGKGYSLAVISTDVDNDNDIDIMVANDFGYIAWPNVLYRNDYPSKTFTDISKEAGVDAGINGMGLAGGDFDEDGDIDYYVTNIGKNLLYRNDGNNKFTNIAHQAGVEHGFVNSQKTTSWGAMFFDYDNDSHLDLFFTSGYVGEPNTSFEDPNKLYHNNGDGTFKDVGEQYNMEDPSKSRGCITGDIDNDGLLDMFVVNLESDFETKNNCRLYMNNFKSANNNWFKVKVQGTKSNRNGYGTKVILYANGRKLLREIDGGSGHMSHSSPIAHWGLAKINKVDSITVIWPGGFTEKFGSFAVNQQINVIEKTKLYISSTQKYLICAGDKINNKPYFKNTIEDITYKSNTGYDSIVKSHIIIKESYNKKSNFGLCENEKFNGKTITKDTVVTQHLKTYIGCDSIETININLLKVSNYSNTLSFCNVAGFEGMKYYSDTTITKKLKNIVACDSNVSITIIVNKSAITNLDFTLCEGNKYKDKTYNTSVDIIENYNTAKGCDSTVNIHLNILKKPTFTLDTTIIKGSIYNGVQYNKLGLIKLISNFPNKTINMCDSSFIVNLIVKNPDGMFDENNINFEITAIQNKVNNATELNFKLPNDGAFTISLYSNNLEKLADLINDIGKKGDVKKQLFLKSFGFKKGTYIIRISQGSKFQDYKFNLEN